MASNKKAFTLVELLVVIAIIGLLATLSVIALNSARAKSRDAKRVADVKQISTALELFFNDAGRYPTDLEWASGSLEYNGQTYLTTIPSAPSPADGSCDSTTNSFSYTQDNSGESYTLTFCTGGVVGSLAAGELCATPSGMAACGGGGGCILDCSGKNCGDDGCGGSCGTCTGNDVCISGTCATPPFACGDQVTITSLLGHTCNADAPDYDTCTYDTVTIGTQCWMKQNMNLGAIVNGGTSQSSGPTLEKYCFDNIGGNCQAAGGFYQWDEAMQYSTSEGAQGICPSGWHVPSDAELNTLDQYLTDTSCDANRYNDFGCANAGNKLKVSGGSGFDAILGGVCYQGGPFYGPGIWASFWSSSMNGSNSWIRHLNASYASIYRGVDVRSNGFSIRCVQN